MASVGSVTIDLEAKIAGFQSDLNRAERELKKTVNAMRRQMENDSKAMRDSIGNVFKVGLGAVAATLSIDQVAGSIKGAIDAADKLNDMRIRFDIDAESLSVLNYTAKQTGTDMDGVAKSVQRMSKLMASELGGARTAFDTLGITVTNSNGQLKTATQILPEIADKFKAIQDPMREAALLQEIFGKAGIEMAEMMNLGSEGMNAMAQTAKDLGLVLSTETMEAADGFNDKLSEMQAVMGAVWTEIAAKLMPVIQSAVQSFIDWINSMGGVRGVVDTMTEGLSSLWSVIKPLGVFIGTAYVANLAAAALAKIALTAATTGVTVATSLYTAAVVALRTALAFLFGPVGLVAAGATALYMLATREDEASKAAELHASKIREINSLTKSNVEGSLARAEGYRQEALAALKVSQAKYAARIQEAKYAAQRAAAPVQGGDRGDMAGMSAGIAVANRQAAMTEVIQAQKALDELTSLSTKLQSNVPKVEVPKFNYGGSPAAGRGGGGKPRVDPDIARAQRDLEKAQEEIAKDMKEWTNELAWEALEPFEKQFAKSMDEVIEKSKEFAKDGVAPERVKEWADVMSEAAKSRAEMARTEKLADTFGGALTAMEDEAAALKLSNRELAIRAELKKIAELPESYFASVGSSIEDATAAKLKAIEKVREAAGKLFDDKELAKQAQDAANAWQDVWGRAAGEVGNIITGVFNRSIRSMKDLLEAGKSLLMNLAGDMAGTFFQNNVKKPMMDWFKSALTGGAKSDTKDGATAQFDGLKKILGGFTDKFKGVFDKIGSKLSGLFGGSGAGGGSFLSGIGSKISSFLGPAAIVMAGASIIDSITGGKLFGTPYKTDKSVTGFSMSGFEASGFQEITESKQRSLFRGKKTRVTTSGLDAQGEAQVDALLASVMDAVNAAAKQLGVIAPGAISASFRQEFDKDGKLTREVGSILGRTYSESQDAFLARIVGENMLGVAKAAGSSAEIEAIAESFRSTGEELQKFSSFILAVQVDIKNGTQLWDKSAFTLTQITDAVEKLAEAGESVAEAYARTTEIARNYGSLIANVDSELRTAGLSDYQKSILQVEMTYRQTVKQAHALAKSLGLSGARTEDLTKIELLRAQQMAQLQQQQQAQRDSFLTSLRLGDLSTLKDDEKLRLAQTEYDKALSGNDMAAAQDALTNLLEIGKRFYASGSDYKSLFDSNVARFEDMSIEDTSLGDVADILLGLPEDIARAIYEKALIGDTFTAPVQAVDSANTSGLDSASAALQLQNGRSDALLTEIRDELRSSNAGARMDSLREALQ